MHIRSEETSRASFGLIWGASTEEIQALGVNLKPATVQTKSGDTYHTHTLPKSIDDMNFFMLSFGYHNRLCRIEACSRSFESDPYGHGVVTRYKELVLSLTEKYGDGRDTDVRDNEIWKDDNEYVMSLHQGRASRYTSFRKDAIDVNLSVYAEERDKASIMIRFTNVIEFAKFEHTNKEREIDAL